MDIKENHPGQNNDFNSSVTKKNYNTETNTKNNNPKKLQEKSKPDDGLVELEGGFMMYPSEILEFSEGADSDP